MPLCIPLQAAILLCHLIWPSNAMATNSSNATLVTAKFELTTTTAPQTVPEVVTTLLVIAGCALLGIGIAKLGDYLYDRRVASQDDISNASDYTKDLLRTRLAVMKMKSDPSTSEDRTIKHVASTWVEKSIMSGNAKTNEQGVADGSNPAVDSSEPAAEGSTTVTVEVNGVPSADTNEVSQTAEVTNISKPPADKLSLPPLNQNRVAPSETDLPPLRPKTPTVTPRSINQPVRSTR